MPAIALLMRNRGILAFETGTCKCDRRRSAHLHILLFFYDFMTNFWQIAVGNKILGTERLLIFCRAKVTSVSRYCCAQNLGNVSAGNRIAGLIQSTQKGLRANVPKCTDDLSTCIEQKYNHPSQATLKGTERAELCDLYEWHTFAELLFALFIPWFANPRWQSTNEHPWKLALFLPTDILRHAPPRTATSLSLLSSN